MILKEGDKVRSIQLPCLGEGVVECADPNSLGDVPKGAVDLRIATVRWEKDPHGHLPEDHSPREDWDFSDLVKIEPCKICGPDHMEYGFHMTGEHSENWVNLADARDTGEVIFMPANLIHGALSAIEIPNTIDEQIMVHVDRRIIQAIVDTIKELDPYGDPNVGIHQDWTLTDSLEELQNYLNDNPERPLANG